MWTKLTSVKKRVMRSLGNKKIVNDPPLIKWATTSINDDFIEIITYSGYRSCAYDPEGARHLLSPDADDESLGMALRDALAKSRRMTLEEVRVFFDRDGLQQRYDAWVKDLMSRYGYKTRRALFKDMKSCGVELQDGVITIRPSNHEKLEGWSGDGIAEEDRVKLPADCSDAELGARLRLAFSRCIP